MTPDEIGPKLAAWLAEYRRRPQAEEVVVATYQMVKPVPESADMGMDAGRVALIIVRYAGSDGARYVMGINARGQQLWDDWYPSEEAARARIESGHYGPAVESTAREP